MNKTMMLGLALVGLVGVAHADSETGFNPANNPVICDLSIIHWDNWSCVSPGAVTLDPIAWVPANKVCKGNSITASTAAHVTDGGRQRSGVDDCGFGQYQFEPITPTLTGNGYLITGPYAGQGGGLVTVLSGELTGRGTIKFHQNWTTVPPCFPNSPTETPEEEYGVFWVDFVKDKKFFPCEDTIQHYGASANLTGNSFDKNNLLWTVARAGVTIDDHSGDITYSSTQGEYLVTATSRDLPACTDSFTLYLLKLILLKEYLGINLEGGSVPDSLVAKVEPDVAGVSYEWLTTEGSAQCVFSPPPGNGASAVIAETGKASGSYLGEKAQVNVFPPDEASFTLSSNFTVVKVNLTVENLAEADEETIGANVPYNNDDDNATVTADKLDYSEDGEVVGEDDLLAVTVTVEPSLPDSEIITLTGSDLFEDKLKKTPAAATYSVGAFPKTFYINGKEPTGSLRDCEIEAVHGESNAKDTIKYTTFMVDVKGPALFEDNSAMDDHIEEYSTNSWGRYVELNDDDDVPVAGNNEWDLADPPTNREQDVRMVALPIELKPGMESNDTLSLSWDATPIGVYSGPKTGLTNLTPGVIFTKTNLPTEFWIEGRKASTAMKDIEMTATYKRDLIGKSSVDKVKLTVCSVDVDGDSDEDGYGGVGSDADDKVEGNDKYPVGVIYNDDDSDQNMALDNKNQTIDGDADKNQMADIIVRKVLPDDIPDDGVVTLEGAPQVRLFKPDGSVLKDEGDSGPVIVAWTNLPLNLKAEGVTPGIGELKVKYARNAVTLTDHLHVGVFRADLDIDSDNTSDFDGPELTELEDAIENGCTNPVYAALKYVVVDDYYNEAETNGVPGYATNNLPDDLGPVGTFGFVPMKFEIFAPFENSAKTVIRFEALGGGGASDPGGVVASQDDGETIYTPAGGNYRIWMKPRGGDARNTNSVLRGGDYVPFGVDIPATNFGAGGLGMGIPGSANLYVEGIQPSLALGDEAISVKVVNSAYSNRAAQAEDKLKFTVIKVDVDVDSDNNNGFDPPARTLAEDHYEDIGEDTNRTGKLFAVNSDDKDEDKVPDFADGYNLFSDPDLTNDDANLNEQFVPVVFEIPEPIDLSRARVNLDYDDSNPLSVTTNPAGEYVLPSAGSMRLWRQKGNIARNGGAIPSGDFVPSGEYTASDFGFSNGTRIVTLYAEAVKISQKIADKRILFKVQPDERAGFIAADAVRLTAYEFKIFWEKKNSPWTADHYGTMSTPLAALGGVPGEPGGAGGFGGPPVDSGFGRLIDPFVVKDFVLNSNGINRTITLKLVSNVSSWSTNYTLTETASNSDIFADAVDSLAVRRILSEQSPGAIKGIERETVFVASMAFGSQRMMTLQRGEGTNTFESERLLLTADMTALPVSGAVDSLTVTLTSSLLPGLSDDGVLVETSTNSLKFVRADGKLSVQMVRITDNGAPTKNDFTAVVTSDLLDVADQAVDAIETTAGSLSFRTDVLHNSGGPGVGPGATRYVAIGAFWIPVGGVGRVNGQTVFPDYWKYPDLPARVFRKRGSAVVSYMGGVSWNKNAPVAPPVGAPDNMNYYTFSPLHFFYIYDDVDMSTPVFLDLLTAEPGTSYSLPVGFNYTSAKALGGDEYHAKPVGYDVPEDVVTVLKVELSNGAAMNDPKPFKYGETTLENPKGKDPETEVVDALVIYYRDVATYPAGAGLATVPDFDVDLKVEPNVSGVTWSKVDGPASGSLIDASSAHARYRNPKRGGLYRFDVSLGGQTARTQLWHPVAGPDISYYWQGEIAYFKNTWGPAYRAKLDRATSALALFPTLREVQKHRIALREIREVEVNGVAMQVGINLDWMDPVLGNDTPCGGPNSTGDEWRQTLHGVVVDFRKRNNMMYALIGREMTLLELEVKYGPNIANAGSPDEAPAFAAYAAGFDLFDGMSLQTVMQNRGYDMQVPGSWAQKEWPSDETSQEGLTRKAAQQLEAMIQ